MSDARISRAHAQQDYDADPPRCGTCLYFALGTWSARRLAAKKGRGTDHLQRCTFGNFHTSPTAVCNEWRNRAGERIDTGEP